MKPDDHDIDELLGRLSDSTPPCAPANVEQNVLRRIRQASENFGWRPTFWPGWLTNPAFGLGTILISGSIGVLFSSIVNAGEAKTHTDVAGFNPMAVFSERAPGMLSPRTESEK